MLPANHVYLSDTFRRGVIWVGIEGLRHKPRHKKQTGADGKVVSRQRL